MPPATTAPDTRLSELLPYVNAQDGYTLMLPRGWEERKNAAYEADREQGVRRFDDTSMRPSLTISIGSADGSVLICPRTCAEIWVSNLNEFAAALISTSQLIAEAFCEGDCSASESHTDVNVGDDPGRIEAPAHIDNNFPSFGTPLYQAFTIHEGRPVVLAFDYWYLDVGRLSIGFDEAKEIVSSFTFLEEEAVAP
jgi:hypothetical protein